MCVCVCVCECVCVNSAHPCKSMYIWMCVDRWMGKLEMIWEKGETRAGLGGGGGGIESKKEIWKEYGENLLAICSLPH